MAVFFKSPVSAGVVVRAGAGTQLDHVTHAVATHPVAQAGKRLLRHRLGEQRAAGHDGTHRKGTPQPALQEKGRSGMFDRGHGGNV